MSKQAEMENIYFSWEWLIKEKLEQIDVLAQHMFSEMRLFGISRKLYEPFAQAKVRELIMQIDSKEGEKVG